MEFAVPKRFLSSADMKIRCYRAGSLELDDLSLDHRRGVMWNPDIVKQQDMYICYDCLRLIVLCSNTALLLRVWTIWPIWTGLITGNCRTTAWELGSSRRHIMACDVGCLYAEMNQSSREAQTMLLWE